MKREREFLDRLARRLDSEGEARETLQMLRSPLHPSFRWNPGRAGLVSPESWLQARGLPVEPIEWCPEGFRIDRTYYTALSRSLEHFAGWLYIQEAASMIPGALLKSLIATLAPGRLLDLAAAPGSKTTQFVTTHSHEWKVIANEPSGSRLAALSFNLTRCGCAGIPILQKDGTTIGELAPGAFHAILVDAPCSGEGVARSDPAVLERWKPDDAPRFAARQKALLHSAWCALAAGGVLVYSTCTLSSQENEDLIRQFLAETDDAEAMDPADHLPLLRICRGDRSGRIILPQNFNTEGFFVAALRKSGPRVDSPDLVIQNSSDGAALLSHLDSAFGLIIPAEQVIRRQDTSWFLNTGWNPDMPLNRPGTPLATSTGSDVGITHELAWIWGANASRAVIDVDDNEALRFAAGLDALRPPGDLDGEFIVRWKGSGLGFVKRKSGRTKTRIPANWTRPLRNWRAG